MISALHDQLSRLAEEAAVPPDAAAGRELWDQGTRYRRALRLGTASIVAAAVVAIAVLSGASLRAAGPAPEMAPADAPSGLPSRIHAPSKWLPGTEDVGAPGRTIAVFSADRGGWLGSSRALVAVSAATGDYRFLDLPDAAPIYEAVLSPDGLRLAYWTVGTTSDSPSTVETEGNGAITGVGIYDTVTGEVLRHDFATEHGLWPDALAWLDPSAVMIQHLQYVAGDDGPLNDQGSGDDQTAWRWDIPGAEPQRWRLAQRLRADAWGPGSNGRTAAGNGEGVFVVDGESSTPVDGGRRLMYTGGYALSPDGSRIAGVWGNNRRPSDVAVLATTGEGGPTRLERADDTYHVDGWRDPDHVVVTRRSAPVRKGTRMAVFSVDAMTGATEELVTLPDGQFNGVQWASDLLDAPVVDRPAPPSPLDPRLITGLAIATLLAAWLALRKWRRRVAP